MCAESILKKNMMTFLKAVWQFVSFLFVPQWKRT